MPTPIYYAKVPAQSKACTIGVPICSRVRYHVFGTRDGAILIHLEEYGRLG